MLEDVVKVFRWLDVELFRINSLDIADVHFNMTTLLFLGQSAIGELCSFSVSNGFQRLQRHEIRMEGEFRVAS